MNKTINIFAISHIGNSRDNQEDNFLAHRWGCLPPAVRDDMAESRTPYLINGKFCEECFLLAVSDGMGGHNCGEVASLATVDYLQNNFDAIINSVKNGEKALSGEISYLNNVVYRSSIKDGNSSGMAATLCGVVGNGSKIVGFNVGDSRVYQLKDGELKQLSTDHTEGQRLLKIQLLTEEEEKHFPRRKKLYKYIGSNEEIVPELFNITEIEPETVLMLCTDGLSEALSGKEMEKILIINECLEERRKRLVDEALLRNIGKGDNITVILMEF